MSISTQKTREVGQNISNTTNLAYSSSSVRTTVPLAELTGGVTLCATTVCYVKIGDENVTASASNGSLVLGAGVPRTITVNRSDKYVAVVRAASDGVLEISEHVY